MLGVASARLWRTTIPEMLGSQLGGRCILENVGLVRSTQARPPPAIPRREGHTGNSSFK